MAACIFLPMTAMGRLCEFAKESHQAAISLEAAVFVSSNLTGGGIAGYGSSRTRLHRHIGSGSVSLGASH
jgi:hypothetical protein